MNMLCSICFSRNLLELLTLCGLLCLVRQNITPATNISRHTDSRRFAHGPLGTGGMADGRFYFGKNLKKSLIHKFPSLNCNKPALAVQ